MSQVQPSQHETEDPEAQQQLQPLSSPRHLPAPLHILKSLKPLFLVSLGIVIGLVLGVLLSASFLRQTAVTAKPHVQPKQAQAIQLPPTNTIGQAVVIGLWQVTVNSANTSAGDQVFAPHSGKVFLVVDVTVQNDSSGPQLVSSGLLFILKDSTGEAYNETITDIGKPPDGTVQAGDKLRGQIVYEVPASEHSFSFQFQDSTYYANVGRWDISV